MLHVQAKLHQARSETREAAHYFRMNLERIEAENITGSDQLDALIYLAEYAKVTADMFLSAMHRFSSIYTAMSKGM